MISIILLGGVLAILCLQLVNLYMQLIEAKARKADPLATRRKGHIDLEETKLERV